MFARTVVHERVELFGYCQIRVLTNANQNPAANTNVSVVSNLANAIWKTVDVVIGEQNLLQSFDNSYNIGSWFDIAINTSQERSSYLYFKEGFYMDTGVTKAETENTIIYPVADDNGNIAAVNTGLKTRAGLIDQGKSCTLISDLNCSLLKTGKLLPSNLDVRVAALTKNYDKFVLLKAADGTHKVKFDKCHLRVTFQQPTDFCLNLMEQKLLKTPAVYQAEEGKVSFHSIAAGNELVTINNLFPQGSLPIMFTFGVQDRSAYGNTRNKNHYTFYPMKKAQIYVDGKPYFTSALDGAVMHFDSFYQSVGYKTTGDCQIDPIDNTDNSSLPGSHCDCFGG